MNKSKITEYDYINFLIGMQRVYSTTQKLSESALMRKMVLRDAYTRQLHRLVPTTERLCR